jgi:tetratricopeptide (TPR) repeat protein
MRLATLLVLFLSLTPALAARAQSSEPTTAESELDERARIHFHAGTDYFERGDYENALRELQIAYEMSGRPALLYNLGACLERMGRLTEAADQLDAYVAAARPEGTAAIVERAQRLRARAVALASASEESAETSTEDTPQVEGPASVTRPIEPTSRARTPHVASWIVLAAGGASLAAFAVLGGLALAEDDALGSRCGTRCSRADVGTLEGLTIGADASLTAGLVLVAVGVVLALVTDERAAEHAGLEVSPGGIGVRF